MIRYLILDNEKAIDRSRFEGMLRGVGLSKNSKSRYWFTWVTHPLTGQEALVIKDDTDLEFFTDGEQKSLKTINEMADADWFIRIRTKE